MRGERITASDALTLARAGHLAAAGGRLRAPEPSSQSYAQAPATLSPSFLAVQGHESRQPLHTDPGAPTLEDTGPRSMKRGARVPLTNMFGMPARAGANRAIGRDKDQRLVICRKQHRLSASGSSTPPDSRGALR